MAKIQESLVKNKDLGDLDGLTAGELAFYFSQFPERAVLRCYGILNDRGDATFDVIVTREQTPQEINEAVASRALDVQTAAIRDHKKYLELKARFG